MQPVRKLLALCLTSAFLLTSCGQRPTTPTTGDAGQPATTGTAENSLQIVVNSPYPGPYGTTLIDNEEMRVGRFPIGEYGDRLVRAYILTPPKTFNPWAANDTQSTHMASNMFTAVLGSDPYTGDLFPDMAESFTVEPDGLTYTTKLRKGLKWSDGKPITAEDVAFTWNTIIKDGYGNASLRDVTTIDGKSPTVTVVDELTNKYVTPKPFAPFARLISGVPVAPKHVIEPLLKKKDGRTRFNGLWDINCDPKSLVTSGPYVLSEYVPDQRVTFAPTKNFYMVNKDKGKLPYFDRLVYIFVPEVNTNLLKFKAKEIDLSVIRPKDTAELAKLQDELNFKLYNLGQSIGTTFITFNLNQRSNPKTNKPYVDPVRSAWFNDVNFRQAVNHALNRDNMVANYFKGIGAPLFTAEPPASPYFNKTLQEFKQDLKYSLSLLESSGFKKKDDGNLYDKDGHLVEFDLLTSAGGTFYEAIGNMIVDDLKKLGMKVNFQQIDFNALNDKMSNAHDWQCCLMSLSPGDPLEPNDGANVWKCGGRMHLFDQRPQDDQGNVIVKDARPWETKLEDLFDQGAVTLDKAKRHQIYDEYQKIVYDQVPFIYLVSPLTIVGARNTLQNFRPTALSQSQSGVHNVEEMYKKK